MDRMYPSRPGRLVKAVLPIALLTALPGTAGAIRLDYEAGVLVRRSDNVTQLSLEPVSDTIVTPRFHFQTVQEGASVQIKADGSFDYQKYVGDTVEDQFRGYFTGKLKWVALPERLDFTFEDYLSRQPVNVQTAFGASNQQQVNLFVAGPSFYAGLGDATRGQVDLRYSNSYAEVNKNFNGKRYNAAARVLRKISATERLSGNLEAIQARFDQAVPPSDYDRRDGYVGYSNTLRQLQFDADAGYSWLELRGRGRSFSSPLVRGSVQWTLSPRSLIDGSISYQFADAIQDLSARAGKVYGPIISDVTYSDVLAGPEVFRQRRAEFGYRFAGERVLWTVRPHYERLNYLDSPEQDLRSKGGLFKLDYQLRPRLTFSLLVTRESRKFRDDGRSDRDTTFDIGLLNELTRHWIGRIDLEHRERDSSVAGQSFSENAIVASITYRR